MSLTSTVSTVVDATRAALANPGDTKQAFRIAEALSFDTPQRLADRMRRSPTGGPLMARREDLLTVLTDRARLEAIPDDSLGRAYLRFLDSEGITAAGLVQASMDGVGETAVSDLSPDVRWMRERMRDSHDLWHTVTGDKGDLLGEVSILAFTFAQTGHPGVGFLASLGIILGNIPGARRLVSRGYLRGRRARWLPGVDWVALLPRPLDEVRRELGIDEIPVYEPVRERSGHAAAALDAAKRRFFPLRLGLLTEA